MRLDKFLKVSRIIKRRTVACEFADSGRVMINGKIAKPAAAVKVGDVLTLSSGGRETRYEILDIRENVRANEAEQMYKILE